MSNVAVTGFLLVAIILVVGTRPTEAEDSYKNVKNQILSADRASREFMVKLYAVNRRMKDISKRRDQLTNNMLDSEANVKNLAKNISILEETLREQKSKLSKRIRALYVLGEDKFLRAVFSANSSEDLQQTLKYLKLFAEQDFRLVAAYESNLKILRDKERLLSENVQRLIKVKRRLNDKENKLMEEQRAKKIILSSLSAKKREALKKLRHLRKSSDTDVLNISFFENKGKLADPFEGILVEDYGMVEHPQYKYRLSHKGRLYKNSQLSSVRLIADGRLVYWGKVEGYGNTAIFDHGDHYYSLYSGLKSVSAKQGQKVLARTEISTGVKELYFEMRHFSDAIDPSLWMVK